VSQLNKGLIVEKEGKLVWLKLNRPEVANCLNKELLTAIQEACHTISQDKTIQVVAIIGTGTKVFSAGADLKERKGFSPDQVIDYLTLIQNTMLSIESLPQPVIAAINGSAFGGGVELALACDIRLMVSHATLQLTEVRLGIIPGAGGTQRLPRLIGKTKAKEMIYMAKPISAQESYSCGLINGIVESDYKDGLFDEQLVTEVRTWANEMTEAAPLSLRGAKTAINDGYDQDLAAGLALESKAYLRLLNTKDRLEGLAAFAEKRKPRYTGE
jgi:enoyl-CoA hydratase/carnithine racemase